MVSSNRKCAYCRSEGPLSREHIIPKFIYSREVIKGRDTQLSNVSTRSGEKSVQSEITIGDVCAKCNNEFLSQLDEYGAKMYDEYFESTPEPGTRIELCYDFELLTRWLLKLAFNSARMRKWPASHLEQLTQASEYIRGTAPRPRGLRVYAQLITSAKLSPLQKQRILEVDGLALDELEPGFRRIVAFHCAGMIAGCLVGMNAYQFYLVFWNATLTAQRLRNSESKFLRNTLGVKRLGPESSKSVIYPSSLNIIDVVEKNPVMMRNIERGADWVRKRAPRPNVVD